MGKDGQFSAKTSIIIERGLLFLRKSTRTIGRDWQFSTNRKELLNGTPVLTKSHENYGGERAILNKILENYAAVVAVLTQIRENYGAGGAILRKTLANYWMGVAANGKAMGTIVKHLRLSAKSRLNVQSVQLRQHLFGYETQLMHVEM